MVQRLPVHLWQSLTWDQGKNMAHHVQFSVDTGVVELYFCDPSHPGSEVQMRTPTGCYANTYRKAPTWQHSLNKISTMQLTLSNGRPRQTLDWMTPSEKLAEVLQ
jgi:IS30 family transposase